MLKVLGSYEFDTDKLNLPCLGEEGRKKEEEEKQIYLLVSSFMNNLFNKYLILSYSNIKFPELVFIFNFHSMIFIPSI